MEHPTAGSRPAEEAPGLEVTFYPDRIGGTRRRVEMTPSQALQLAREGAASPPASSRRLPRDEPEPVRARPPTSDAAPAAPPAVAPPREAQSDVAATSDVAAEADTAVEPSTRVTQLRPQKDQQRRGWFRRLLSRLRPGKGRHRDRAKRCRMCGAAVSPDGTCPLGHR